MTTSLSHLEDAGPDRHCVHLYGDDDLSLTESAGAFMGEGLTRGEGVLAVATATHLEAFRARLVALGTDPAEAERRGSALFLDAEQTLEALSVNDEPDWSRFEEIIGQLLGDLRDRVGPAGCRAYGDMVGVLWKRGRFSAAIQLELFWNRLLFTNGVQLFCSYPIDILSPEFQSSSVNALLCAHTHLVPSDARLERALNRALDDVLGAGAEAMKRLVEAMDRPTACRMAKAEATILWLRNLLPDRADEIIARTREHFRASLAAETAAA